MVTKFDFVGILAIMMLAPLLLLNFTTLTNLIYYPLTWILMIVLGLISVLVKQNPEEGFEDSKERHEALVEKLKAEKKL